MNDFQFGGMISDHLAQHPDHLGAAIAAITQGMLRAMDFAEANASIKDQALLVALCMVEAKRSHPELKELFLAKVATALSPDNASAIERRFINMSKAAER